MKTLKLRKTFKTIALTLIFPLAITTTGCSSSDDSDGDDGPNASCDQLSDFSTEYTNAFTAFQANPSEQTCNDLRNVALDFIDAVEDCPQFADQYSELEEAAQGWTDLDCSGNFD